VINFYSEDIARPKLKYLLLKKWIKEIVSINGFNTGSISIIFCTDSYLLNINKDFLKHDYFTDIITFNYNELNILSGDIFISLDTVKSNSIIYNSTYENELLRVIIHGVLHLIGFNDKSESEFVTMKLKEDESLFYYYNSIITN
jgi:probable rRNA maturation factor